MKMTENKSFYSVLDLPKAQPSSCGSKIYEWDWKDETGAIKHDKKDLYSEIQSYKNSVDYIKLIKQGVDLNGFAINDSDNFGDVTNLQSGDFADYCNIVTNIANNIDAQVENINNGQSQGKTNEVSQQGAQVGNQSASNSGQPETNGNQQQGGNN